MYQIGIMGSAADLNYNNECLNFAKELGGLIAKSNNILVYGAEKEYSSLSTEAAISASNYGGITVGIAPDKGKNIYGEFRPTVLIPCGLGMGGGREFVLVNSCDAIIAISGGSGTLTEMAIAYQANIPIITIDKFKGWSKKMANKYFDDRKRLKCLRASTPKEALDILLKELERRNNNDNTKC